MTIEKLHTSNRWYLLKEIEGARYAQNREDEDKKIREPEPFVERIVNDISEAIKKENREEMSRDPNDYDTFLRRLIYIRKDLPDHLFNKAIIELSIDICYSERSLEKQIEFDINRSYRTNAAIEKIAENLLNTPKEYPIIKVYLSSYDMSSYRERLYSAIMHEIRHANDRFESFHLNSDKNRVNAVSILRELCCNKSLLGEIGSKLLSDDRNAIIGANTATMIKHMLIPIEIDAYIHSYLGRLVKNDNVNLKGRTLEQIFNLVIDDGGKENDVTTTMKIWLEYLNDPQYILGNLKSVSLYDALDLAFEVMLYKDYRNQYDLIRIDLLRLQSSLQYPSNRKAKVNDVPDLRNMNTSYLNGPFLDYKDREERLVFAKNASMSLYEDCIKTIVTYLVTEGRHKASKAVAGIKKLVAKFADPVTIKDDKGKAVIVPESLNKKIAEALLESFRGEIATNNLFIIP